jgi:hypothetical protein
MAPRACALVLLAAGMMAGRPAVAAMTVVVRLGPGKTVTFHQQGSRIRMVNPSGNDEGEVVIVDLETKKRVLVYDDAKAYFDYNKALAAVRDAAGPAALAKLDSEVRHRPAQTTRYRPTGEVRTVNGFSCVMYQRVIGRRVDAQICFAQWGDAIGREEDFAWLDALADGFASAMFGKRPRAPGTRADDKQPGLGIWQSSAEPDGTRTVSEILKISREPLPAALFTVPADYREIKRPLSASERSPAPPPTLPSGQGASTRRFSGVAMVLLAAAMVIGLLIHAGILHLAAHIVLDRAPFPFALIAAAVAWAVLIVANLIHLPLGLEMAVVGLATFVGLKISYGAPIGRTLLLFLVSGMIVAGAGYAAAFVFAPSVVGPGR